MDVLSSARNSIMVATSTANASNANVLQFVNQTASTVMNSINTLTNTASASGINITNCTENNSEEMTDLSLNFAKGLINCPINEANKGLAMIDRDVQYIYDLGNTTLNLPTMVTNCNVNARCLASILGKYTITIAQAPVKISLMITEVTTYVNMIQTNLGICAVGSTFASLSDVTTWGVNKTICISNQIGSDNE